MSTRTTEAPPLSGQSGEHTPEIPRVDEVPDPKQSGDSPTGEQAAKASANEIELESPGVTQSMEADSDAKDNKQIIQSDADARMGEQSAAPGEIEGRDKLSSRNEKDSSEEDVSPSGTENGNGRENQVVHTKSVSIKGALKGGRRDIPIADKEIGEEDLVKNLEETEQIEITEEEMQKAWLAYADSVEKSHPRIYSTLKQHIPRMTEIGKISIQLNTQAQRENFVHNIKPGLNTFLQEKLANIEYVYETQLIANEVSGKKVYTDQDKLEYLMKKNRELEKFKTRFNLDFDD